MDERSSPSVETSRPGLGRLRLTVLVDQFPELSETFIAEEVRALIALGHEVQVEAAIHARNPNRSAARGVRVAYGADDRLGRKLVDLAWLVSRHPLRCARDFLERRRWRREEPVRPLRSVAPVARRVARSDTRHLHAHFATAAALDALRLGVLLRLPYSVATHGYDIFREPRNLREKHERAAFAVSACDYSVQHLRRVVGAPYAARIHKLVVGIDGERFRRSRPYPGGRSVIAVARLVEKKGLRYLIEAVASLESTSSVERLCVVGGGPLQGELERLAGELGVREVVHFLGAREPHEVRALLERADVLAMPCVIARDGDRDTMPVVVKEALAMEVPVVASDEVGLPEVVRPEWGRLAPPGDALALADAIRELLELAPARREELGRAGRAWVLEHCNLHRETRRLTCLIERTSGGSRHGRGH